MSDSTEFEVPESMRIDGEESPPAERPLSSREQAMQAIIARTNAAREAEMQHGEVQHQEARDAGLDFPDDEPEPAKPVAAEPAPVRAEPAPPPPAERQTTVRTIEYEGRPVNVTDEQYQHLARLGMVANVALHQYQPNAAPAHEPEPPKPLVDPDRIRHTVKQIQYGGEDDAAAALTQLVTDVISRVPVAPQIDQNSIIRQAAAAATEEARAQAKLARDTEVIQNEFGDIFAHPQRVFLAKTNVDVIRERDWRSGLVRPDIEVYREAGNMVREAMGLPQPGRDVSTQPANQALTVASRADTIERKRSAPRTSTGLDRRAPSPEMPRAPSASDVIDRMRAQRGQASMR